MDREALKSFVTDLHTALKAPEGSPLDNTAIELAVRAFRIYTGEEEVSILVSDPQAVIDAARKARTPLVPTSEWDPNKQAWRRKTEGQMAADHIERMSEHWKFHPMPPKPKEVPVEIPVVEEKISVMICFVCKKPALHDDRFTEDTPMGTCCGDGYIKTMKEGR